MVSRCHPYGREWHPWNQFNASKQRSSGRDRTFLGNLLQVQTRLHQACAAGKGSPTERRPPWKLLRALSTSISHWSCPARVFTGNRRSRCLDSLATTVLEEAIILATTWPFSLVVDRAVQTLRSVSSHAFNIGCQCSFELCCMSTATWRPDTASMLRTQGIMCRCLAFIGTSLRTRAYVSR